MDRAQTHYHIRWSGKETLDWEDFGSRGEAEEAATQLVRPGETYTIEEQDETCVRCRAALELKTDHAAAVNSRNPQPKYAWQQAVIDASTESRPEYLPKRVNAAQRAISARLCEKTPTDLSEQLAIRDALNFLRTLLPDRTEPERESDSKAKIQSA